MKPHRFPHGVPRPRTLAFFAAALTSCAILAPGASGARRSHDQRLNPGAAGSHDQRLNPGTPRSHDQRLNPGSNHRSHGHGRHLGSQLNSHGQLLHLAPHLRANANQSNNWFGYNQGTLEQGGKLFHSITGDWTVPAATQHTSGEAESSSDWIGIGGGCVDAGCTVTDPTLIQTGTEQDVSSSGAPSYFAWYELVPAPEFQITSMSVSPGDHMSASISEAVPNADVWTITLKDVTNGQSFTTTAPYPSTHGTAEWIEETPLLIGTNAGFAALPNLATPAFDLATTNGAPANLKASEEMNLVDSSGKVIGAPSAPDPDTDGFNACTWAGTCTAPSGS